MTYRKQTWRDYDDTKTEHQNRERGAVVTPERLNHIETGIANSADKQEVTAQLAQKANRSYVDTLMGDITDGSPKEIFSSIEALEDKYPNGAVGPMLVVDSSFTDGAHSFIWSGGGWVDLGVYQATGIPKKSIGLEKLNESSLYAVLPSVKVGSEMDWSIGAFYPNGGNLQDSKIRIRSLEYTHVSKGNLVRLNNYDNHKFMVFKYSSPSVTNFISVTPWLSEDYLIEDPCFIRVIMAYHDDRDMTDIDENELPKTLKIMANKVGKENILDSSIKLNHLSDEVMGLALPTVIIGSEMDWRIGSLVVLNGRTNDSSVIRLRTVDYTQVNRGDLVQLSDYSNHKFMVFKYSSPSDATFISASSWNTERYFIDEPCFIKILIAYRDDSEIIEEDIDILSSLLIIRSSEVRDELSKEGGYYFRGGQVPAIPVGSSALGYNEFINQTWETLRTEHPDYIKREVVIRDTSDEFDIYEYTFTPEHYERTIFLVTGIHGDEYEANWGLYYFMKNITEESHNYERLRDLYYNVRFVVIPILNPWGVENRTRANSRDGNANNNYDVFHRSPEYEEPAGAYAFSENEALVVKLVADKYNAEFDFFADFHTDRYNPEYGNYILTNRLSSTYNTAKELTLDEIGYLEQEYGFITTPRTSDYVGTNRRSSSFKYMEAVRGVPSALLEVGTGRLSPIGSSLTMRVGVDWFTNIITEMLKQDLTQPKQPKNALEQSILENRIEGYSHSVYKKIPDKDIQVFLDIDGFDGEIWENKAQRGEIEIVGLNASSRTENGILFNNSKLIIPERNYDDFTLVIKGTVNQQGMILTSGGELMLKAFTRVDDSGRYNIYNGDEILMCSALRYGEEVTFGVKSVNGRLYLYVNGEPFNDIPAIHSTESQLFIGGNNDLSDPIDMSLKSLVLYDRALKDDELGFVLKSFILH